MIITIRRDVESESRCSPARRKNDFPDSQGRFGDRKSNPTAFSRFDKVAKPPVSEIAKGSCSSQKRLNNVTVLAHSEASRNRGIPENEWRKTLTEIHGMARPSCGIGMMLVGSIQPRQERTDGRK
jgi:hypothetical protein